MKKQSIRWQNSLKKCLNTNKWCYFDVCITFIDQLTPCNRSITRLPPFMSEKEVAVSEDILNVIQSGQVKTSTSNKLSLLM